MITDFMPKTRTYYKRGRPTKEAQALAKRIKADVKKAEAITKLSVRLGKLERKAKKVRNQLKAQKARKTWRK